MRYGYQLAPAGSFRDRGRTRATRRTIRVISACSRSRRASIVSAALRVGGEVTDPAGEPTGYAATYYPGTPNVAEAQRVNVTLGQEASNVAFALTATRLVRATGAVINNSSASRSPTAW